MKKIGNSLSLTCIFLLFLNTCPGTLKAQNTLLTDAEKKTLLVNFSKIIGDLKNNFKAIKKGEPKKYKLSEEWETNSTLFPRSTNNNTFSKIGIYWTDSTKTKEMFVYQEAGFVDFSTVSEILEPYLFANGFEEIATKKIGSQFIAKAFRSKEGIVEIFSNLENENPTCVVSIGKLYYYNTDVVILRKSLGSGNKSFGFVFYTNSKDTVIVKNVISGSPALKAGMKEGDFIKKINGIDIGKKTLEELNSFLKGLQGKAVFSLLRNNKPIQFSVEKEERYKFDKECLSGNCVNGTGLALSKTTPGLMLEGVFKEGELVDGNWYMNAKSSEQKGFMIRQGKLMDGRYFTGLIRDRSKPNGGWWYKVKNHDITKFNKITSENFNGEVKCFTANEPTKCIWEGEFEDGRKEGFFHEYLYDKNLEWSYKISNGVMSKQHLRYLGTDKNINGYVGMNLVYDSIGKTWSGKFSTEDCCYEELTNVSSFADLDRKYQIKKGNIAGGKGATNKPAQGKEAEIEKLGNDATAFAKSKTDIKARLMSLPLSIRKNDRDYKEYKLGIERLLENISRIYDKYKGEINNEEKKYLNNSLQLLTALYLQIDS